MLPSNKNVVDARSFADETRQGMQQLLYSHARDGVRQHDFIGHEYLIKQNFHSTQGVLPF